MLSPHGRMSPFQQAQMFSLQDANIHNIAIEGVFDDCQDLVKAVSADLAFKRRHAIGTVNSINWARLLAQVVYYFAGYFQATRGDDEAGRLRGADRQLRQHLRRPRRAQHGPADPPPRARDQRERRPRRVLPHRHATACAAPRETHETSSPSMDISKASNFERFVFDALGRDPARTRELFAEVETRREFTLDAGRARARRRVRLRQRAQHRRPTGWRRSATCTSASAR